VFRPISHRKNRGEKLEKKVTYRIERRKNGKETGEGHVDKNVGNNGGSRRKNGHGFPGLMTEIKSVY
jgi:hypothetical protein